MTFAPVSTLNGTSCPLIAIVHVKNVPWSEPTLFRKAKSSNDSGGSWISPTDFEKRNAL